MKKRIIQFGSAVTGFAIVALFLFFSFAPVETIEAARRYAAERISILCATESGNCVESWNGSDIVVYSDRGSTQTFAVDGATGNITGGGGLASDNVVVSAPTAIGTATPAVFVNNAGVSKQLEVQDGGVVAFDMLNGGGARFTAPTAIATAQPGVVVDSNGVSNIFEVRDNATPVIAVNNGGTWSSTGAGTHSGGQTINNWAIVAAPTDIATATPAAVVNSSGVSNIFEIRDAATPVIRVEDGGSLHSNHLGFIALSYTSTGAQTITPTNNSLYNLNPAAVLTVTLSTGAAQTGDIVIFANNVTTNTIIADTGATQGGGNITLGENDNAGFLFLGDAWIEIFSPDNS